MGTGALNRPCPRCGGSGTLPATATTTDQDAITAELTRDAWDRLLHERDGLRVLLDEVMATLRESADADRKLKEAMLGFYKREQRKAQQQLGGSDDPPRLGGHPPWPERVG